MDFVEDFVQDYADARSDQIGQARSMLIQALLLLGLGEKDALMVYNVAVACSEDLAAREASLATAGEPAAERSAERSAEGPAGSGLRTPQNWISEFDEEVSTIQIFCENFKTLENAGYLRAIFEVRLVLSTWTITMKDWKVVQKPGQKAWVSVPQSQWTDKDTDKVAYKNLIELPNELKERISTMALEIWDKMGAIPY